MLQKSDGSLQAIGNRRQTDTQIISQLEPSVLRLSPGMNDFWVYARLQLDPASANFSKPFQNFSWLILLCISGGKGPCPNEIGVCNKCSAAGYTTGHIA